MSAARRVILQNLISSFRNDLVINPSQHSLKITYSSPTWPFPPSSTPLSTNKIRIAILDSSFNPPTKAHIALLQNSLNTKNLIPVSEKCSPEFTFDACLLLYAARNADKILGPGDTSTIDRLLMMEAVAEYIRFPENASVLNSKVYEKPLSNIAVGIISAGLFIDKATKILPTVSSEEREISLYFIAGYDTLIRLFNQTYYTSFTENLTTFFKNSCIIYANRAGFDTEQETAFLNSTEVEKFKDQIWKVEIGKELESVSSTMVRELIAAWDGENREEIKRVVNNLLPEPIIEYVLEAGLYRKK